MPILMGSRTRIEWRRGWSLCRPNGASLKRSIQLLRFPVAVLIWESSAWILGVNIFAQSPDLYDVSIFKNPYVCPPICLIPHVIQYRQSLQLPHTIVIPDVCPRRFWWPLLTSTCSARHLLAVAGTTGALPTPSKNGFSINWPIPWDLWVFYVVQE